MISPEESLYLVIRRVRRGKGANPQVILGHLVLGEYSSWSSAVASQRAHGTVDVLICAVLPAKELPE